MQNLSKTNLLEGHTTPITSTENNHNSLTSTMNRVKKSTNSSRYSRPPSRAEMLFDFDRNIPLEAIDFTNKMLGRGQFGQVELAYAMINGIRTKCAVKMIRGRLAINYITFWYTYISILGFHYEYMQ